MPKAVPVNGFPAPAILEAEQYKSVKLSHQGEDKNFNYPDTNGFAGKIDAQGTGDIYSRLIATPLGGGRGKKVFRTSITM